jgi:hypothetical protein
VKTIGEVLAELPADDREAVLLEIRRATNAAQANAWADSRRVFQDKRDRLATKQAAEVEQLTARAVNAENRADLAEKQLADARATVDRLTGPDAEQERAAERLREIAAKNVGPGRYRW